MREPASREAHHGNTQGSFGSTSAGWPACWRPDIPAPSRTLGGRRCADAAGTKPHSDNTFSALACPSSPPGRTRKNTITGSHGANTETGTPPRYAQPRRRKKMILADQGKNTSRRNLSDRRKKSHFKTALTALRTELRRYQSAMALDPLLPMALYPTSYQGADVVAAFRARVKRLCADCMRGI